MRTRPVAFAIALPFALLAALPALPLAARAVPASSNPTRSASVAATSPAQLTDAQKRAFALEDTITELEAERIAIDNRIDVTTEKILRQSDEVWRARQEYERAEAAYDAKLVAMYKSRSPDPVSVLLESRSFWEMIARATFLARVAERDRRIVRDAAVMAAEADYQAAVLEDLKAEDLALKGLRDERIGNLGKALDEQKALIARLTTEQLKAVLAYRASSLLTRKQWEATSIPQGTKIRYVQGTVEPYEGSWTVSEFHPKRYRATGKKLPIRTSWYGPGFNGRRTASGQIYNQLDLTCASRTLPFGTRIAITYKGKRMVVMVNDRGPYVPSDPTRNLDLSAGSRSVLGFWGVIDCEGEFVEPIE